MQTDSSDGKIQRVQHLRKIHPGQNGKDCVRCNQPKVLLPKTKDKGEDSSPQGTESLFEAVGTIGLLDNLRFSRPTTDFSPKKGGDVSAKTLRIIEMVTLWLSSPNIKDH